MLHANAGSARQAYQSCQSGWQTFAAVLGQTDATVTSNDTVIEDADARIERELAQMKEDRLKAIQALPRSVWS